MPPSKITKSVSIDKGVWDRYKDLERKLRFPLNFSGEVETALKKRLDELEARFKFSTKT